MTDSLYALPLDPGQFKSYCGGNLTGDNESCVEVAEIPGTPDVYAVQDNKPDGAGRQLRFTAQELDSFALGWIAERGLTA
jgi:hypothetical protein